MKIWHDKEFVRREELETALEQSRMELARVRFALESFKNTASHSLYLGTYGPVDVPALKRLVKRAEEALSPSDSKAWLAGEIEKRVGAMMEPDLMIVHYPHNDSRRHTSWVRWATDGECPADLGRIECVKRINKSPAPTDAKGETK